jgi:hypothetical protein
VGADQGPPVQPNKASSRDERLPDLRAIVPRQRSNPSLRESLLASLAPASLSVRLIAKIGNERFHLGGNREPRLTWNPGQIKRVRYYPKKLHVGQDANRHANCPQRQQSEQVKDELNRQPTRSQFNSMSVLYRSSVSVTRRRD